MPHFYFDIETTGLNPDEDEIISIQYMKIALHNGQSEGPLEILTTWTENFREENILKTIAPKITSSNPFTFVPVGNNLDFEFKFLASKFNKYFGTKISSAFFHSRPSIDLKPLMVLLNGGRFKGYHHILNKSTAGAIVPVWYRNKEYAKIVDYIKNEALVFVKFYSSIHDLMFDPAFRHNIFKTIDKRLDDYV